MCSHACTFLVTAALTYVLVASYYEFEFEVGHVPPKKMAIRVYSDNEATKFCCVIDADRLAAAHECWPSNETRDEYGILADFLTFMIPGDVCFDVQHLAIRDTFIDWGAYVIFIAASFSVIGISFGLVEEGTKAVGRACRRRFG